MKPVLSEASKSEIRRLTTQFPQRQSALLGALFVAQEEAGALYPEVIAEVAEAMELPVSEVTSVASFYHLYRFAPEGRHLIQVCTNISCLLSGCDRVLRGLKQRLDIEVGETTPDGRFTLKTAECLAACEIAPMMMVGPDRHGPLAPEKLDEILARYG
ncbi:MAG TPA: NADH-quinone oxidoreductase subunit NuoE [bacterium]|nr:NADH-quinone oxidoreductase subunit NuoE [bacterium]